MNPSETIKKLLRLSKSPNHAEAELALSRALEIAERHNIDIQELSLDDDLRKIVQERIPVGWRVSALRRRVLYGIVEPFFNVDVILGRPSFIMVGTRSDIAIATYVYEFCCGCLSRSLSAFARESRRLSKTKRHNYIAGWIYGLASTLKQQRAALMEATVGMDLMIRSEAQRRADYVTTHIATRDATFKKRHRHDHSAMIAGILDGKQTKINAGLGSRNSTLLIGGAA